MLHRRVRAGEHEGLVPVLMSEEIGRGTVPPVDLDDLGRLRWLTDDPPVEVQLVSDNCAQCLLLRGPSPSVHLPPRRRNCSPFGRWAGRTCCVRMGTTGWLLR